MHCQTCPSIRPEYPKTCYFAYSKIQHWPLQNGTQYTETDTQNALVSLVLDPATKDSDFPLILYHKEYVFLPLAPLSPYMHRAAWHLCDTI